MKLLHTSYPAYEDGTDRVFRNVGIQQSDAGEIPKRIHTTILTLLAVVNVCDVFTSVLMEIRSVCSMTS